MKDFEHTVIQDVGSGSLDFRLEADWVEWKHKERYKGYATGILPLNETSYWQKIPDLPARVLSGSEIKRLKDFCIYELLEMINQGKRDMLRVTQEILEL